MLKRIFIASLFLIVVHANGQEVENKVTFEVPIILTNIHQSIHTIKVECGIYDEDNNLVAYGYENIRTSSFHDGNIDDIIVVDAVEKAPFFIGDGVKYMCDIQLLGHSTSSGDFSGFPTQDPEAEPGLQCTSGTPDGKVEGRINWE